MMTSYAVVELAVNGWCLMKCCFICAVLATFCRICAEVRVLERI